MNGVHDMGGRQDFGPVEYEKDEPVFHAAWEGRVWALTRALSAWRKWNIDVGRHAIERLPPIEYLRMTYYERWLARMEAQVVEFGMVTKEELATGQPAAGSTRATPPYTLASAARVLNRGIASSADPAVAPRFAVGQQVRTRNINPTGHTRLPRYARDKTGVVVRDHGVYVFADSNAHFQGERRQHVYAVRFAARELWGAQASPRDTVHLDLWDDHLDRA
jgi:nitrile hydratase beta subunit